MERDFLGLKSKEPVVVVKEEVNTTDGFKDIGFGKGSGVQWPFSNKVTAVPHFMNFKVSQEDKGRKMVSEPLVSSGFLSVSSGDGYDQSRKLSSAEIQKSFNHDRHGGTHVSLTAKFPVNQTISVPVNNSFYKNHFATVGRSLGGANSKQQLLGGIPVSTTFGSSIIGTTEQCNGVKPPAASAPLTIFYAGAVNVYEDISPEKAQAIMLLAGNGVSMAPNAVQPKVQPQTPNAKTTATNGVTHGSGLPSPISVSSHTGAQSGSGSTSTEEVKTTAVATTPVYRLEPPKTATNVMVPVATTSSTPEARPTLYAAFPQYRKASLASFLEKRKQRVMNAAPYVSGKKTPDSIAPEATA